VNLLMQPLALSAQDAVPFLHPQRGAGQAVVLGNRNVNHLVGAQKWLSTARTSAPRRADRLREQASSARITSAPAARAAAPMPLRAKHDPGRDAQSVTIARRAPASRQSGSLPLPPRIVLAACRRAVPGGVRLDDDYVAARDEAAMPPSSWIARRAIARVVTLDDHHFGQRRFRWNLKFVRTAAAAGAAKCARARSAIRQVLQQRRQATRRSKRIIASRRPAVASRSKLVRL